MPLRKLKPTTPGQRHAILPDFAELTASKPQKKLVKGLNKTGGRNNQGRITSRHRGGGHKRRYRFIDFKGLEGDARVVSIEYDPNRSARIALVVYKNGVRTYVIASAGMKVGDEIRCGEDAALAKGNRMALSQIPDSTQIYNIELVPGKGGQMVRAAGTMATLMVKSDKYAQVKLPSGEVRLIDVRCMATIGQVGNFEHKYVSKGKAGRSRWLGVRPQTRGVAMNPIDHPHGGGEGKSKGHLSQSPWGWQTKGYKTRNKSKASNRKILQKRK